jgi:hypothetical protein
MEIRCRNWSKSDLKTQLVWILSYYGARRLFGLLLLVTTRDSPAPRISGEMIRLRR